MNCPKCKQEFKLVPAGISKTGKPYKAFYSCQTCHITANVDGSPTKSSNMGIQSGNNEIMNALRKIYTLIERLEQKIDSLSSSSTSSSSYIPDLSDEDLEISL